MGYPGLIFQEKPFFTPKFTHKQDMLSLCIVLKNDSISFVFQIVSRFVFREVLTLLVVDVQ